MPSEWADRIMHWDYTVCKCRERNLLLGLMTHPPTLWSLFRLLPFPLVVGTKPKNLLWNSNEFTKIPLNTCLFTIIIYREKIDSNQKNLQLTLLGNKLDLVIASALVQHACHIYNALDCLRAAWHVALMLGNNTIIILIHIIIVM